MSLVSLTRFLFGSISPSLPFKRPPQPYQVLHQGTLPTLLPQPASLPSVDPENCLSPCPSLPSKSESSLSTAFPPIDAIISEKESSTRSFSPSAWDPRLISDATIGLSDGLTVPFALSAGLSALGTTKLVIFGGLAELTAGAISMGLGGYLAARSEAYVFSSPSFPKSTSHPSPVLNGVKCDGY